MPNFANVDAIISLDSPSPPESPSMLLARHSANGYTNISTASANLNAALLTNSFDAQTYLNFPDFTSSSSTQSSIDRLNRLPLQYFLFTCLYYLLTFYRYRSIFLFLFLNFYFTLVFLPFSSQHVV